MVKSKIIIFILVIMNFLSANLFESAILKSIILPGWGEASIGAESKSRQFLFRESMLWISFSGSGWIQSHYKKAYIQYAYEYANIDLNIKPYQYAVDIGNYNSINEYNQSKARRRQFDLMIDETIISNHWFWENQNHRLKFDKMRITSGLVGKSKSFIIAGMIAHRIISMINVLYLSRNQNIQANLKLSGKDAMYLAISIKI